MRILLIRHGETVDNVAGNYAGVTDSALTNHGVLQAQRLGAHLEATNVKTAAIFSSDLQRAFKTAEAIRVAQSSDTKSVIQLAILREQDFGFYEGKRFYERPKDSSKSGKDAHLATHRNDPGFIDVESKQAMTLRADTFVSGYLLDLMKAIPDDETVVVVAHGIILNHLWRSILRRFPSNKVTMAPGVGGADRGLEYLGGWSNTGYLDLEVKSSMTGARTPVKKPSDVDQLVDSSSIHEGGQSMIGTDADTLTQSKSTLIPPPTTAQVKSLTQVCSLTSVEPVDRRLTIKAVNSLEHLKGLKKARGGTGSLKHDSKQKTMESFFKKRKTE